MHVKEGGRGLAKDWPTRSWLKHDRKRGLHCVGGVGRGVFGMLQAAGQHSWGCI